MLENKKLLIVWAFIGVLSFTLVVWLAQPAYRRWATNRAAARALSFLSRSDYANASLSARRALQINSNCVVACRVFAELHERSRLPRALNWRQRVVELEPNNDSNQLALARTALVFSRAAVARQALSGVSDPSQRTRPEFHDLAAQIAFAEHDIAKAQEHLREADRLDPTNAVHNYNLQIVRLHASDSNVVREARCQLDAARADPVHGGAILRALVREALGRRDLPRADERSLELQKRPDAEFGDRLLHLTILDALAHPPEPGTPQVHRQPGATNTSSPTAATPSQAKLRFETELARTETEAGSDPDPISLLASWLNEHGLADAALPWLESFPDEIRRATPVRLAEAESYLARRHWGELGAELAHSQWGDDDYLRHAILALVYRQQGDEQHGRTEWKHAIRAANDGVHAGSKSRLALVRLAGAWSWEHESEELLWDIAGQGPENRWALAVLRHAYEIGGDTRALLRVFQEMLNADSRDFVAQNNFAATSLLLGTNLPAAHQLARQAYSAQPTNATVACTYAYSMHLQGRTAEGLKLLSKLPEESMRNPETAAYYGLLLSAQGSTVEAEKYLALARKGCLLPEERALIERDR